MPNKPSAFAPEPTHAGGIVYRMTGGVPCYLLVSPRSGAPEWVLPKGHIESGEDPAETAVREVREETGVQGRVVGLLGQTAFRKGTKDVVVAFYLLAWVSDGPAEEDRTTRWFRYADALEAVTHADNRGMLECAEARRRASPA